MHNNQRMEKGEKQTPSWCSKNNDNNVNNDNNHITVHTFTGFASPGWQNCELGFHKRISANEVVKLEGRTKVHAGHRWGLSA